MVEVRLKSGAKIVASLIHTIGDHRLGTVLDAVVAVLGRAKISMRQLSTVVVMQGQGTFTMARLTVAVANTLAWLYGIPSSDAKIVRKRINRQKFIVPTYRSLPNISSPVKKSGK